MDNETTENTNQQPSPENKVDAVTQTINKLRDLGLDPNAFITLFIPVLEQLNRDTTERIRQEMQATVQQQAKLIGEQIVSTINTAAERKVVSMEQPVPGAQPVDMVPVNPGRQSMDIGTVLPLLLKLMGGGGEQTGGLGGSLKQMAETAKLFGTFYSEMMSPLVEIQAKMRQNVLNEMTTYSKTGGELPWEKEVTETKRPQRVELNQEERDQYFKDLGKRIRLT